MLEGKTALVTGGSGRLGRAICEVFVREGARVSQLSRSEVQIEGVTSFRGSVSDAEAVKSVLKQVEPDILVNNAGVGQVVPVALMEERDWDRMFDTSVKGAFLCSQAALRPMIRRRSGHILNISSLAGVKMMQAPVHYASAKAALRGFTEALAKEVGRYGIQVNGLAPGILEGGVSENLPPKRLAQYLDHCAMGRVGTVEEVAEVAAFVVSKRNSYMNGATLVLDGAV